MGLGVLLGVVLDRDLGRHPAHGVGSAAVADLDQELAVGAQEVAVHAHRAAVGQDEARVGAELLDEAEDVVPATAVQSRPECSRSSHRISSISKAARMVSIRTVALTVPRGMPSSSWAASKTAFPEARLHVALELGQVEVGRRPRGRRARVRCGTGTARSRRASPTPARRPTSMFFSSRCQPRGRTKSTAVSSFSRYSLPVVGCTKLDGPPHGVPRGCAGRRGCSPTSGEFESSKSAMNTFAPEFQRVDHHLAVDRTGDLDAPIGDVGGDRRDGPIAPRGSPASPPGSPASIPRRGAPWIVGAPGEELRPAGAEAPLEPGHEGQGPAASARRRLPRARAEGARFRWRACACPPRLRSGERRVRHRRKERPQEVSGGQEPRPRHCPREGRLLHQGNVKGNRPPGRLEQGFFLPNRGRFSRWPKCVRSTIGPCHGPRPSRSSSPRGTTCSRRGTGVAGSRLQARVPARPPEGEKDAALQIDRGRSFRPSSWP